MLHPLAFKQSRDVLVIYDLFKNIEHLPGKIVTWNELTAATGKTRVQISWAIAIAIRRCREEFSLIIENDRGIGYRLRSDTELETPGYKRIRHLRRHSRVTQKILGCANRVKMTVEQRTSVDTLRSVAGIVEAATNPRTIKQTTQMVIRKSNELTELEQLEAIADALKKK
jgi:hypothetical protein